MKVMQAGILSCGSYIPPTLVSITENPATELVRQAQKLGVKHTSQKSANEDTVTLGIAATTQALSRYDQFDGGTCTGFYLGTETPTYAVGNNAAAIADFVGITGQQLRTATMEFACRAGSLAFIQAAHEVMVHGDTSVALGCDIAHGQPDDILSFTGGIGGASFLLGGETHSNDFIAELKHFSSYTNRTSDFWRANDQKFPQHARRMSCDSYVNTMSNCLDLFFEQTGTQMSDFDHVIVHQPNLKLPHKIFKKYQVNEEQYKTGLIFEETGNMYAGMVLVALTHVLEQAQPNQNILCVSYGSGAGSDALWLRTTDKIYRLNDTDTLAHQISTRNNSHA